MVRKPSKPEKPIGEIIKTLEEELKRLNDRSEQVIDEFKAAQHNLFALSSQDHKPQLLEDARLRAVAYYEAYLDLISEIKVKEKRYTDLTS